MTNSTHADFEATVSAFKERLRACGYDALIERMYQMRPSILHAKSPHIPSRVIACINPYDPFSTKMGLGKAVAQLGADLAQCVSLPSENTKLRTLVAFQPTSVCLIF